MPAALLFGPGADPSALVARTRTPVDRAAPVRPGQFVSLVYRYDGPPGSMTAGEWAEAVRQALTNLNGSGTFVLAGGPLDIAQAEGFLGLDIAATPFAEFKIRTLNSIPAGLTWARLLYQLGPLEVRDAIGPWNVSAELVGAYVATAGPGGLGAASATADALGSAPTPSDRIAGAVRGLVIVAGLGAVLYLAGPVLRRAINRR